MVSEENRVRSNSSNAARTRRSAPRLPCGASGAHEILQSRDDMMQLMSRGEKSLARNGGSGRRNTACGLSGTPLERW